MYEDRLRSAEWEVRPVRPETARLLIESEHYTHHTSNTVTYCHGLFRVGEFWEYNCAGVAWWIPPTKSAALATYPDDWQGVLSLSRLVIVPDVPKNACSFLLARSMKLIDRHRWPCLVTYADEWQGHTGGIYRATNWDYVGLTKGEMTFQKDGKVIAKKRGNLTRTYAEMEALGAQQVGRFAKHKFVHIVR